jgi:hypothetical protein
MNNPFLPVKFPPGPPTAQKNVWEDGPSAYVDASGKPIIYNGQNQTSRINTAAPKPPDEDGPGFADPGYSNVNVQGPLKPNYSETPTIGVGTIVPVGPSSAPAQARMFLQGNSLYILDNNGTAYVIGATATIPQPAIYSPTK